MADPLRRPPVASYSRRCARGAAALLAVLISAACTDPPFEHRVSAYQVPTPTARRWESWAEVFAQPSPIRATALITGWVEAGPSILIDAEDERVPDSLHQDLWVPSLAYLVEHPRGRVLLDAGLRAGNCAYGLWPIYWVPCRNQQGSDAASQLRSLGLAPSDLDAIVISHFHGDHASGLEALTTSAPIPVISTRAELAAMASRTRFLAGYERRLIPERLDVQVVDEALVEMPIVGRAVDLFGDASLWLIPTPGHTRGHLSVLINASPRPLLLTFDASHLLTGFEVGAIPGFCADEAQAREALGRLRELAATHPQIRVLAGHEPSQWNPQETPVVLAEGASSGPPRPAD